MGRSVVVYAVLVARATAADDGKRCFSGGRCACDLNNFRIGECPGEGGTAIGPDRRQADDGKRCFSGGR